MEKLIKLLNEYEYSRFEDKSLATERGDIQDWIVFEKDFCKDLDKDSTMNVTHLISYRYGFISWLVKNDKIDLWNKEYECYWSDVYKDTDTTDAMIMELSIQDEPIKFLVSILK